MKKFSCLFGLTMALSQLPFTANASFIETTIGTAIVNDATASLHNPGALVQVKNPQLISLVSFASYRTRFSGEATLFPSRFTQSGISTTHTHYFLPSFYAALPVTNKVVTGIALVTNFFNRDMNNNALLRYVQSRNAVQDINLIPAIGVALTPSFSIGVNLDISYVFFDLRPVRGVPGLNIPDNQSINTCHDTAFGTEAGVLYKPTPGTLMGLDYRSAVTYHLRGKSRLVGTSLISSDFHFNFWTPARIVFSLGQRLNKNFGMIATVQYIRWSIYKNVVLHNIATALAVRPVLVPRANIPFHLHNGYIYTLGGLYHFFQKNVLRIAGSFVESPGKGRFQIDTGDSFNLAVSVGFKINHYLHLDAGYSHAFIKPQAINIRNERVAILGKNQGLRDALSLKATLDF